MTEQTEIIIALNELAEFRAKKAGIDQDKQVLIDGTLTEEIKTKVDEIEAEFHGRSFAVNTKIEELERSVKEKTVGVGSTVKGTFLAAIFNKGRQTWDTKALKEYAKSNPEIMEFLKQGNPYVSIKGV